MGRTIQRPLNRWWQNSYNFAMTSLNVYLFKMPHTSFWPEYQIFFVCWPNYHALVQPKQSSRSPAPLSNLDHGCCLPCCVACHTHPTWMLLKVLYSFIWPNCWIFFTVLAPTPHMTGAVAPYFQSFALPYSVLSCWLSRYMQTRWHSSQLSKWNK